MSAMNCYVCGGQIAGRYLVHHWGAFCSHHSSETRCFACSKVVVAEGGVRLSDGRAFCASCHRQAVTGPAEARLHQRIARRFIERLGLQLGPDVPLELHDKTHPDFSASSVGVTKTLTRTDASGREVDRQVTSVAVLNHLPVLQFESVMAHELFHVWEYRQRQRLSRLTSEGCAELCSFLYLDAQPDSDMKFVLKEAIEQRDDDIYGAGFRAARRAMERYGFAGLIRHALRGQPVHVN